MRLFSTESTLYRFIVRFWDVVKINFLWLVFSLPVVTIGPATVAAYSVTLKMVDDEEGYVARQFVAAFKSNFRQGLPLGLMAIGAAYLSYLNFEFFNKVEGNPVLFLIAALLIAFVALVHLTYAFPLAARYENTLKETLKNASTITQRYFVRTLALWVILAILIVLFWYNSTLLFFGILIGPVSVFLTVSGFALWIFKDIDQKQK